MLLHQKIKRCNAVFAVWLEIFCTNKDQEEELNMYILSVYLMHACCVLKEAQGEHHSRKEMLKGGERDEAVCSDSDMLSHCWATGTQSKLE